MKNYIVGIGGSGHRCLEAIIHLSAVGLLPCEDCNLLFVDSDGRNGNFVNTRELLSTYIQVKSGFSNTHDIFRTTLKPTIDTENCLWSPIEGDNQYSLSESNKNLMNLLGYYPTMTRQEKILFDFLYTDREKKEPLVEGFYGHPSIGSTMMANNLESETDPWLTFINNLKREAVNDEVRVFLIASIFGGTGASGFPIISKYLRDTIGSSNLKIGGILVLPYFKFDNTYLHKSDNSLSLDSSNFMAKAKTALYFYDTQQYCEKLFDRIYLLGDSYEEFTEMSPASGNIKQKNKPHIVELLVGFAAAHFFGEHLTKTNQKIYVTTRKKVQSGGRGDFSSEYVYDWSTIDNILGDEYPVKNQLAQFLRFAVAYTKHFYPIIEKIATSHESANAYRFTTWYQNYFVRGKIDVREQKHEEIFETLQNLNEYCCKFMKWIVDLHLRYRVGNNSSLDSNMKLFNTADASLFDGKLENNIEISNFSHLVFGHAKAENSFSEIYHDICSNRFKGNQSLERFQWFVSDLYKYCALK